MRRPADWSDGRSPPSFASTGAEANSPWQPELLLAGAFQSAAYFARQGARINCFGSAPGFGTNFCVRPYWLSPP